jgi:hypothetical protein
MMHRTDVKLAGHPANKKTNAGYLAEILSKKQIQVT